MQGARVSTYQPATALSRSRSRIGLRGFLLFPRRSLCALRGRLAALLYQAVNFRVQELNLAGHASFLLDDGGQNLVAAVCGAAGLDYLPCTDNQAYRQADEAKALPEPRCLGIKLIGTNLVVELDVAQFATDGLHRAADGLVLLPAPIVVVLHQELAVFKLAHHSSAVPNVRAEHIHPLERAYLVVSQLVGAGHLPFYPAQEAVELLSVQLQVVLGNLKPVPVVFQRHQFVQAQAQQQGILARAVVFVLVEMLLYEIVNGGNQAICLYRAEETVAGTIVLEICRIDDEAMLVTLTAGKHQALGILAAIPLGIQKCEIKRMLVQLAPYKVGLVRFVVLDDFSLWRRDSSNRPSFLRWNPKSKIGSCHACLQSYFIAKNIVHVQAHEHILPANLVAVEIQHVLA